jgi:serine/threonine-protein kinase RsbW
MNKNKTIQIPSALNQIKEVTSKVLDFLKPLQLPHSELLDIRLCLEEALVNAIKHGNKLKESRQVKVDYEISNDTLKIAVSDEGEGFDPDNLPNPTVEENLKELKGRGVYIIKRLMDKVEFNEKANKITMTKYIGG